jgi:cytochrome c-550 PedF
MAGMLEFGRAARRRIALVAGLAAAAAAGMAFAHGDVAPQPVNTDGLPAVGEDRAPENPYRDAEPAVWEKAVRIGGSAYNQNCARCHGLEVVSGGLAPDLRFLEADDYGDEWFLERTRHGVTLNGVTRMPGFEEVFNQEAMWAIRTYIEARPDDRAMGEVTPKLREVRDDLEARADAMANGQGFEENADGVAAIATDLALIAEEIPTLSGAPVADSIARRASMVLAAEDGPAIREAAEILTIGLSAAQ